LSTIKKNSLCIFKPHRTVLINNKTTKQHYLFFYFISGFLPERLRNGGDGFLEAYVDDDVLFIVDYFGEFCEEAASW